MGFDPLSLIGDLGGGLISSVGSIFNNAAQMKRQEQQQQWETEMSNTAYQRQTKDMRAAGLNPMMAALKGGGASTPSAPAPAQTQNALAGLGAGVANAGSFARSESVRLDNETKLAEAQQRNMDSQVVANLARAGSDNAHLQLIQPTVDNFLATIENLKANTGRVGDQRALDRANAALATSSAASNNFRLSMDQRFMAPERQQGLDQGVANIANTQARTSNTQVETQDKTNRLPIGKAEGDLAKITGSVVDSSPVSPFARALQAGGPSFGNIFGDIAYDTTQSAKKLPQDIADAMRGIVHGVTKAWETGKGQVYGGRNSASDLNRR